MRKRTVFRLCPAHEGKLGVGRRRAETIVEGGPGRWGSPCETRYCEVKPGLDYYAEGCTDEEFAAMIRNWSVNRFVWMCRCGLLHTRWTSSVPCGCPVAGEVRVPRSATG